MAVADPGLISPTKTNRASCVATNESYACRIYSAGTFSYSNVPGAWVQVTIPAGCSTVEYWSTEKNDRGQALIFINDAYNATVSAFLPKSSTETATAKLWSGPVYASEEQLIRIVNLQGTTGAGENSFIGVDKIVATGCSS